VRPDRPQSHQEDADGSPVALFINMEVFSSLCRRVQLVDWRQELEQLAGGHQGMGRSRPGRDEMSRRRFVPGQSAPAWTWPGCARNRRSGYADAAAAAGAVIVTNASSTASGEMSAPLPDRACDAMSWIERMPVRRPS